MLLTTILRNNISTTILPEKVSGQYWLYDEMHNNERIVSIEGINDEWVLESNRHVKLVDRQNNVIKNQVIVPNNIYFLFKDDNEKVYLITEPVTEDRQVYNKYAVIHNDDITIGRDRNNDICFDNSFVSSFHAVLTKTGGKWILKDQNSTNGTYVNSSRILEKELHVGDLIYIIGLKIIIGKDFIAINNPDGRVTVTNKFQKCIIQRIKPYDSEENYEPQETKYFYRSPRLKREIEVSKFRLDTPPANPTADEMPWVLVMGSSIAMGMMSFVTLFSAIATNNVTSMIMGGSMLVGTLLIPTITRTYERRRKHKKEETRQKKYKEYLDKVKEQIEDACQTQEEILRENYVPIQECELRIREVKRNLWERSPGQNDFLKVRIGHGDGLLNAEFSYQERKFTIEEDNLQEELLALCEKPKTLHNIPITVSLFENHITGVIGERKKVSEFAKGLIIQLASLFSYDEVKFVFLYDKHENNIFEFVKWLPHVWSNDEKFRFLATDLNETKEVSAQLESIISSRLEISESERVNVSPYYIVFSLSKRLSEHMSAIKQILSKKENLQISIISFCDELKDLPKECKIIIQLTGLTGRLFDKDDIIEKSIDFIPDIYLTAEPLDLSVCMANTHLNIESTEYKLPKKITFLEMFGVGKVEHLNSRTRWKENDPTKSLEAAVGIDAFGDIFKLDLHEKFHGPHGLVAGMTGSGKSEFIITYILSLAVNYTPNEVAFILIDYKGGGMAKAFEHLPHTAGIITNLDGSSIKRSLISIESELKRRQSIFAETSKKLGISNIDIYKYQKLFREGSVLEPLQHLFIISDEFAELKTQQPEFMTQLVSAARIGRSLGIHLILATQKPSGVVDDQIWSNSKFRVCLKVQEKSDSMDMLKRPDAAELTDTGRFYLQVGYNELFEIGQSAWAGATYYPSDKVQAGKDNSVVVIDTNGHPIKEAIFDNNPLKNENTKKQLDAITDYLDSISSEEGIKTRSLWLDPIPAVIMLDDIRDKYKPVSERFKIDPVIGEYDDPAHQRQCLLRLPVTDEGNVVVYGSAGSGKTSFLATMIYSLIHEHTPEEVNIYILDFASETLRAFSKAPHVGDIIFSYENEKVSNLFKMLYNEIKLRKKMFADYGGDYLSYIKSSGNKIPAIVVAINNFASFTEIFEEKEESVSYLSREGIKYGIYFVLTAMGTGDVRFRMLQNFKQILVLQLNDESDYSAVIGKTDGLFPSKCKGRGLVKRDGLYEFQVASLTDGEPPFIMISDECRRLYDRWIGETARRVPVLPDVVDTNFLKDFIVRNNEAFFVPVGVEKNSLKVHQYPFGSNYINMIMSSGSEYQGFTEDLSRFIGTQMNVNGLVFDASKAITTSTGSLKLVSSYKDCKTEIDNLFNIVLYRNNTYKDSLTNGTECEKYDQIIVIINSLSSLKSVLDDQGYEKLSLILEKGTVEYGITIIISDQVKACSSVAYEKWYKTQVSSSDGIWIGNGISEQYQMTARKTTSEMRDDISSDFGFSLVKGQAVKIKLLSERLKEEGYDE